jgi:hypothetical protein
LTANDIRVGGRRGFGWVEGSAEEVENDLHVIIVLAVRITVLDDGDLLLGQNRNLSRDAGNATGVEDNLKGI